MVKFRGIAGRWMLNGIAVVLVVVIVGVSTFALAALNYYYSAVRMSLMTKAKTASEFFTSYVSRTYAEYYQSAYKYTEDFEDKDRLELQFVNTRGRVEASSYGITANTSPGTEDIINAIEKQEISVWTGKWAETGERIMAVSCPILYSDGTVVGVMRYVTSLKLVDKQVFRTIVIAAGVGLLIIIIVVLSNLYFIRTITGPIHQLIGMTKRISEGSYGILAEKKYDDEIGELIDSINEMSVKIGQAEKTQAEFISSVSHELRTPLTAITGWSETLLYDDEIQGDSRRGLQIIAKEAGRLTKMVEDLLEFTRIQDGRFNLNLKRLDVAAELEESIFTFNELLRQEKIELRYSPSDTPLPMIMGDPERLRQVFLNILDNAAKYGRSGKIIDVSTALEGEYVAVRIRDYGPGIPAEELPHVKKKFYKGSSKERGSGIGLSVCDEIITRHNGLLDIQNAQGGGVLVTVRLPVSPPQI
ncbi:MAG TPA: HAMP domain-containing histidine kinase [Clostridiales bacterium]|nr:HAMP domain-containing histidine kinase [Clostridiales bacterium]